MCINNNILTLSGDDVRNNKLFILLYRFGSGRGEEGRRERAWGGRSSYDAVLPLQPIHHHHPLNNSRGTTANNPTALNNTMPFVSYSEFTRDLERQKLTTKQQLRHLEAEERRLLKNPSLLKVVFSPVNLACWMLLFATVGLLAYLHFASQMARSLYPDFRAPFVFLSSVVEPNEVSFSNSSAVLGNSSDVFSNSSSVFSNSSAMFSNSSAVFSNNSNVFSNSSALPVSSLV